MAKAILDSQEILKILIKSKEIKYIATKGLKLENYVLTLSQNEKKETILVIEKNHLK